MLSLRLEMCMILSLILSDRIDRERFGFDVEAVALDAGYLANSICKGISERNIFGVIAHRSFTH